MCFCREWFNIRRLQSLLFLLPLYLSYIGSRIAQAGLELLTYTRLALTAALPGSTFETLGLQMWAVTASYNSFQSIFENSEEHWRFELLWLTVKIDNVSIEHKAEQAFISASKQNNKALTAQVPRWLWTRPHSFIADSIGNRVERLDIPGRLTVKQCVIQIMKVNMFSPVTCHSFFSLNPSFLTPSFLCHKCH